MKASAAAITLAALVAACGGSPTQPSQSQAPTPTTVPATGPQSPPSDPPTPAPTPTPTPAPAPPPAPQPDWRSDASTDGGYWSNPSKALPTTFAVVVWPDRVQVGGWTLPRDTNTPEHIGIVAADESGTFTLQRGQLSNQWVWKFGGAAGQASGTAQQR